MSLSTSAIDSSDVVFFPPREVADFVVHYADTAFHVHKFVLQHHSAYFRAYFQTAASSSSSHPAVDRILPNDTQLGSSPSDAVPSESSSTSSKRARLDTPPSSPDSSSHSAKKAKTAQLNSSSASSDPSQPCDHPHIAHCIHLPQQTTLVEQKAVTAANFELFLRHLYFSAHYCYPPYLPKTDVDLDADCPPLSQTFSAITSLDLGLIGPLRFHHDGVLYSESLLALAHYLDCAAMMAQCEAVMLTQVGWAEKSKDSAWLARESLWWLPYSARYGLSAARQHFIRAIAADKGLLERDEYKVAKQHWDKTLVLELMEAMARNRA